MGSFWCPYEHCVDPRRARHWMKAWLLDNSGIPGLWPLLSLPRLWQLPLAWGEEIPGKNSRRMIVHCGEVWGDMWKGALFPAT